MMHDIVVTDTDHSWLDALGLLIAGDDAESHAHFRALEYFIALWHSVPQAFCRVVHGAGFGCKNYFQTYRRLDRFMSSRQ